MATSWLNKSEYPFTSRYFEINGNKLHYIEEGSGEIILFIHGTPSWSFDYRNVIKKLKGNYTCIAPDYIGFGLSSKPEHYDYSLQNHSQTLEEFVLKKQLSAITLVLHDFGVPIGIHFALMHPHLVKNLVILNSWLWNCSEEPSFIKLSKLLKSPLLPFLYRYLNFSPRFVLPSSFGSKKLEKHLLGQYTKPFAKPSERNGPLALAKSLLTKQNWFEYLWENRHPISSKPTLFIWGMKDPVIPPTYLEKFRGGFPNSKSVTLETCGHFPQEEQAQIVADSLLDFLNPSDQTT